MKTRSALLALVVTPMISCAATVYTTKPVVAATPVATTAYPGLGYISAPVAPKAYPSYGLVNIGPAFTGAKVAGEVVYNSNRHEITGFKRSLNPIFAEVGFGKYVYCGHFRTDITAIALGWNNEKKSISFGDIGIGTYKVRYHSVGGMANLSYDFTPELAFSPYVTVGIGALRTKLDVKEVDGSPAVSTFLQHSKKSKTSIAGRVGAGGIFKLNPVTDFTVGYGYIFKKKNLGSVPSTLGSGLQANFKAENIHTVTLGFRFIF